MEKILTAAPGAPGISPRWTPSSKDGVGTAINLASAVSFTLSHGILNEIYYPRNDKAAIRDMELIITNGKDFFSEEKRHTVSSTQQIAPGVPAFLITNVCKEGRYSITKQVITDPTRDTVIQHIEFKAIKKDNYHLYGLLAPHLNNQGMGNTAWVADYKGHPVLFAQNDDVALAFVCSIPWKKRSAGFVGFSDGWQDLKQHFQMNWEYQRAENGNVALWGEIDWKSSRKHNFDLAIGFGLTPEEAAHHALSSILEGFDALKQSYIEEWINWQRGIPGANGSDELFRVSASVLKTHQSKSFPGAMLASLSIPWGNQMGDDDESGYHLVWPRDMVECAGGLLAMKKNTDAIKVLNFLMVTQESDGHWSQNLWLDGRPCRYGIQLDETALPVLLVDLCIKQGAIHKKHLPKYWPTIRKAVAFLLRRGLITEQDRWEEQSGISAFTASVIITALLIAADLAEEMGEKNIADYCRQNADAWNDSIDTWLYAKNTHLSRELDLEGYYLRINPTTTPAAQLNETLMQVKNKPIELSSIPITEMVSTDPLALVRFGLRDARDPRILNTVKVIDRLLKKETLKGDCWYRYTLDGYGEHTDGSAYDGTGSGRPWPLLTAERAHYEIAAGNLKRARQLLHATENFSNNGLLPEQIWDREDIPAKGLFNGQHSGSAMPLVWAHAEYIKLVKSLELKAIFDMPRPTEKRYLKEKKTSNMVIWRPDLPVNEIPAGKFLRIETIQPATIRWTMDEWKNIKEEDTIDMGLDIHYLDLIPKSIKKGIIRFTLHLKNGNHETEKDYMITMLPNDKS